MSAWYWHIVRPSVCLVFDLLNEKFAHQQLLVAWQRSHQFRFLCVFSFSSLEPERDRQMDGRRTDGRTDGRTGKSRTAAYYRTVATNLNYFIFLLELPN